MEASVRDLRVNEAQMRTRAAVAELARLAAQVQKGLDPNLALLLRPDGHGGFVVISGHRRWLALMIAFLTLADLEEGHTAPASLMQVTIEDVCGSEDGFVLLDEELYTFLQEQMPETLTVPYRLWDGLPMEEVLLLIKANSGAEAPDLVGQARAFAIAHARGVPYDRLARVTGLPMGQVRTMIEMLALPDIFLQLLNDELLRLEVIPPVFGLSQIQVKALAEALKIRVVQDAERLPEGQSLQNYTNQVELAILQMAIEPEVPKRTQQAPESVNRAITVQAIWERARAEAPDQLYRAIAIESLAGQRLTAIARQVDLLAKVPVVQDCFEVHEGSYGNMEIMVTDEAMKAMSPDRECAGCAFIDLPAERVHKELPLPCRSGPAGSAFRPCWHWTPKGRKLYIRTPMAWRHGYQAVHSFQELLKEWQAQYDREQQPRPLDHLLSGAVENVDVQRQNIQAFMEQHLDGRFDQLHPWATVCARCAHHLDKSPLKSDPEAPHCLWAKGRRRLQFRAFVPLDAGGKDQSEGIIPFCMQFSPDQEWAHIVPEAVTPPPFSRGPMLLLLKRLAQSVNRNVYSTDCRAALQFLTGRPAKASANHRQTFVERLIQEEALLSNLQIWTLLQWVIFEWQRVETGSSQQMVPAAVEGYYEAHVTYFGQVMPGGVMEEVWDDE